MKYTDDSIQQQIETYLRQEMTDLDRSGFERRMHDDAELHEEVRRQEALIGAIRQERILALKSGLQNVNISLWSTGLMEFARIAAISAGLGVASLGAYYYYQQGKAPEPVKLVQEAHQNLLVPEPKDQPEVEFKKSTPAQTGSQNKVEESDAEALALNPEPLVSGSKELDRTANTSVQSGNPKTIKNSFQPEAEALEPGLKAAQPETSRDISPPEDGISAMTAPETIQPEVVIKRDNKDKFHYQFSEGKLVLYADFNEKLYEVLELNQHNEKQLYLAYDGRFFVLEPSKTEISPLREVKDQNLVQILGAYQKRKN